MAQWAGRASGDLHTFMYFNSKGAQEADAIVTRIRRSGLSVVVPRYGIDGTIQLSEDEWSVNEDEQQAIRLDGSATLGVFSHLKVKIEADDADFRNKTTVTFVRQIDESEREEYKRMDAARKQAHKEMFPDRLVQEAN